MRLGIVSRHWKTWLAAKELGLAARAGEVDFAGTRREGRHANVPNLILDDLELQSLILP
jgi:hypothetical protein